MKNYKIIFIVLLSLISFANVVTAEAKSKYVYSHYWLDRGILYSMYVEYDENNKCIGQWTIHINTDGDLIKTEGWKYPYPGMKGAPSGPPPFPKINADYFDPNSHFDFDTGNTINDKLQIKTYHDQLFVSGYGIIQIANIQTGEIIVKDLKISGEMQQIYLPGVPKYNTPYSILLRDNTGAVKSNSFFFSNSDFQIQSIK